MKYTGNPDYLAIHGSGFFKVDSPNSERFTRDRHFDPVVWDGQIPEDSIDVHVNPDGIVVSIREDTWETIGQIQLTHFANPFGLLSYGQNIFF